MRNAMAKAKTSSFILTQRLGLFSGGAFSSETIDLASYIDVADRQAVAIESVDFIWQDDNNAQQFPDFGAPNTGATVQLHDRNRTSLSYADNINLIASGAIHQDDVNGYSSTADNYPDVFGTGPDSRICVNDTLYLVGAAHTNSTNASFCTVRIKAKIVTLSQKDWMAIAIQATSADN